MSVRTSLLPVLDIIRGILADPNSLDLRPTRVYIRHGVWDGGEALLGGVVNTDTEITPRPKVVERGNGVVEIGPITPAYSGGGWAPATLNPAQNVGEDVYLILVGPSGKLNPYRIISFDGRRPLRYMIVAEQLDRARPNEGW